MRKTVSTTLLNGPEPDIIADNLALMLRLLKDGALHEYYVNRAANLACFWISNRLGKGDRCPHWSVAAQARHNEFRSTKWPADHGLVHEHIVPRKRIIKELMNLSDLSSASVLSLLKLSIYCIVTKDEDKRLQEKFVSDMPPAWQVGDDVWARYNQLPQPIVIGR